MAKDYYKILGITDEEKKLKGKDFEKVLKTKYKKIAIKTHPDKNPGDKAAEEKFKEATEAYSTLLNKRDEYDNPISGGMNFNSNFNFDSFNVDEILRGFGFNMNPFGGNHNVVKNGSNIRIKMHLSLLEMYNGVKKKIKYHRLDKCNKCNGSGKTKDSKTEKCPHCGGTGKSFSTDGFFQTITTCQHCMGKGTMITNPCSECGGRGISDTLSEVEIEIPKGVMNGMQMTVKGYGNAPENMNGNYGNLIVDIVDKNENEVFYRDGNDLHFDINIPVIDAILGCNVTVETINGKKLTAKIKQGTEDGTLMRFKGYGMPVFSSNEYGNMIGEIKLIMPKNLTDEEKKILESLKEKDNFKNG